MEKHFLLFNLLGGGGVGGKVAQANGDVPWRAYRAQFYAHWPSKL